MTFLSSPIHCSTTLAISAIDIDLVVNSLLNQGKVALTSGWEPQRFVHHLWNRLTFGWLFLRSDRLLKHVAKGPKHAFLLSWWLLLLLLLLFLRVGDEHVFDLLVTDHVDGLFSVVIDLVDIGPIGQ